MYSWYSPFWPCLMNLASIAHPDSWSQTYLWLYSLWTHFWNIWYRLCYSGIWTISVAFSSLQCIWCPLTTVYVLVVLAESFGHLVWIDGLAMAEVPICIKWKHHQLLGNTACLLRFDDNLDWIVSFYIRQLPKTVRYIGKKTEIHFLEVFKKATQNGP